jgi:hypothetical protein
MAVHPDFASGHTLAALIDLLYRRYPDAEVQFRLADTLNGENADSNARLARGIADPNLRATAAQKLEISPDYASLRSDPIIYATFLTHLGEHDRALAELEDYAAHHNSTNPQLLWDPALDPIRTEPRFKEVMKKLGLPYKPVEGTAP